MTMIIQNKCDEATFQDLESFYIVHKPQTSDNWFYKIIILSGKG